MTKKTFIALAEVIKLEIPARIDQVMLPYAGPKSLAVRIQLKQAIAEEMADFCQSQNAQFDRERFLAACGVTK